MFCSLNAGKCSSSSSKRGAGREQQQDNYFEGWRHVLLLSDSSVWSWKERNSPNVPADWFPGWFQQQLLQRVRGKAETSHHLHRISPDSFLCPSLSLHSNPTITDASYTPLHHSDVNLFIFPPVRPCTRDWDSGHFCGEICTSSSKGKHGRRV